MNVSLFEVGGKGENAQLRNLTTASTAALPLRVSSEGSCEKSESFPSLF